MEVIARVLLTGFDGQPAEADLALEAYDLSKTEWRGVAEILKPLRIVARTSRDQGRYEIAFRLNAPAMAALFGATASFRLVTAPVRDDGRSEVILAAERIAASLERVEMDFGTVLFLGDRGFVTVSGEGGTFCSGLALAAEDPVLAAAQRRFYARPHELEELAAAKEALGACETAAAKLTRQNATLTQRAQQAAADLRACVAERGKLTERLAAATARAAAADTSLKACAAERDRLTAELATRTKALDTVTAARDACIVERGKLAEQLAAATARVAAVDTGLKACVAERDRLTAELAARTKALDTVTAARDACAVERGKLAEQLAAATARVAAVDTSLKACAAERDRLTAELTARTKALDTMTAARDACAVERGKLAEQLAAAAAHAATADTGLKACAAERDRLTAELAARTKALDAATAARDACAVERGKVTEQLAAATARAAAADTSLKACVAERGRLSVDLAARTKALATATAERDACLGERGRLAEQSAAAAARAAAAEANFEGCVADRERAAGELAVRTKDLADAVARLDDCAQAREALDAQLAEARAGLDATLQQLQALQAEFRDAAGARARAESDLAACRGRTAELETAVGETGAALEACRLAEAEAGQRASAAELARVALNDRLLALEAETQLRAAELAELRERVSNERSYVDRLRDMVTVETAKANVATEQLEAVRRQHQAEVPATQLIAGLASSIGAVNRELVAADIPYRLGRTDLTIRTFLSDGGGRMALPDAAYRVEDAALSEFSMELIPDEAPAAAAAGELIVPDLLGLTETAVIRVLSSLFLKADKAIETVADPARHGRALHQIPRAGAPAQRGQTVLVVYGAQEGP